MTNISPNLDTDILPPWSHRREGRNLIGSIGRSVSPLPSCFSLSAAPSLSLTYPSLQSLRGNERKESMTVHLSIIDSSTIALLNQRKKETKGQQKEHVGHVPHHGPTVKMEVCEEKKESFSFTFSPLFMQAKVSAYFVPPLSSFNLSSLPFRRWMVGKWTGRWMRARRWAAEEWVNEADCSLCRCARDYREITHSDSLLFQFRSLGLCGGKLEGRGG